MAELTWCTVGGCPRSGTTAFGEVLNKHPDIALLHEYDQAHFFATVEAFFREEDRLLVFPESKDFAMIPRRALHKLDVVRAVMQVFTGKNARVYGTKFPGAHLWRTPIMPDGIVHKNIHITRAPYAAIASYALKMMREGYPGGYQVILDTAIAHWISAWNYAISRRHDEDFLHLFYERIGEDSDISQKIARFLGVEGSEHFDFSSYRMMNKDFSSCRDKLMASGFGEHIELFDALSAYADWDRWSRNAYAEGKRIGFPVRDGECIDLSTKFGDWKYPTEGFYPPEQEGRWINGEGGGIDVIPMFDAPRGVMLTLEIPWAFTPGDSPSIIEIGIDGKPLVRTPIALHERNGSPHRFYWLLDRKLVYGRSVRIDIRAINPRNPKILGISNDDRHLSVMLRSLTINSIGVGALTIT